MAIKVGYALGGGGARGLAHIGIIKILEREGFDLECIGGASIGAVVGGTYALTRDARHVEEIARELIQNPYFRHLNRNSLDYFRCSARNRIDNFFTYLKIQVPLIKGIRHISVYDLESFEKIFDFISDTEIENLKTKFCAIASDLISGQEVVLDHGSLKKAMMASAAIPAIFPPIEMNGRLLIDGSTSDSVPVHILRERGAKRIIAVNVSKCVRKKGFLSNTLDILYRSDEIASYHLTQERLSGADIIIRPDVGGINWANFDKISEIIALGEKAAEGSLPEIEKLITGKLKLNKRSFHK